MIETDAPFLMPKNIVMPAAENAQASKPRVNDPALLGWVLKKVAACYGKTEEEIAIATTANAIRLFSL
jgi:TatD DNase family protein